MSPQNPSDRACPKSGPALQRNQFLESFELSSPFPSVETSFLPLQVRSVQRHSDGGNQHCARSPDSIERWVEHGDTHRISTGRFEFQQVVTNLNSSSLLLAQMSK